MKNCIVAQSGGPTSVINSSAVGVYERNLELKCFDKVLFGINGIEGILNENIIDTSNIPYNTLLQLKHTPASGLGSCRFKMPCFTDDESIYEKVISILNKNNIDTFFYIGGNDSMDTVLKLSQYCSIKNYDLKFIGIPKTIDNDLFGTDSCPGFGSAGRYIATSILETYLDASVYPNNGIFIIETMGRDTGWLASTAALATIDDTPVVDLIYLPEYPFNNDKFLEDVSTIYKEKNKVYIVVSEGIKDSNGKFLSESSSYSYDKFGHNQLGGAANKLKELIISNNITSKVKSLELGTTQRCSHHIVSDIDLEQANSVGRFAVDISQKNETGVMVAIDSNCNGEYSYTLSSVDITLIANKTKYFPTDWINAKGNNICESALAYLKPLVDTLPNYVNIY